VGGLRKDGKGNEIKIYRRVIKPEDKSIIEVSLEDIAKQKSPDVPLRPFDIIDVPQQGRGRDRRPLTQEDQDSLLKPKPSTNLPLRIVN
jgi:hypothetical protein